MRGRPNMPPYFCRERVPLYLTAPGAIAFLLKKVFAPPPPPQKKIPGSTPGDELHISVHPSIQITEKQEGPEGGTSCISLLMFQYLDGNHHILAKNYSKPCSFAPKYFGEITQHLSWGVVKSSPRVWICKYCYFMWSTCIKLQFDRFRVFTVKFHIFKHNISSFQNWCIKFCMEMRWKIKTRWFANQTSRLISR